MTVRAPSVDAATTLLCLPVGRLERVGRGPCAGEGRAVRLSKIRIVNFRNFRDLVIDPFPTPAVIVGENGVGKSNLLYALRLVLDPDLSNRWRRLQADDIHDGAPRLSQGVEVRVEVELADFDDDDDAIATLDGAIITEEGQPRIARLTYLFQPKLAVGAVFGAQSSQPLTPDDYTWTIYGGDDAGAGVDMRHAKDYVPLSVLPALRDAEGDFSRADRSPLVRLLRERPPAPDIVASTLDALKQARNQLAQDASMQQAVDELASRLAAMTGPQLPLTPSLDFAGREDDLIRSVQLLIDPSSSRGIQHTSTGTANVVYLALLLERLKLRRQVSDGEDTLLAVEEPEAHLHPSLQRKLFAHLLHEPNRLLLTTHSPHIAAVTPLSSIVLTSTQGDHTVGSVVPPGVLTDAATADLERYINVTRAEILFARGTVLVEGAADAYLLPALAEAAGFPLDDHGIVVSSVEGTDFAPYATLLGPRALRRPHWVLTDGDAADGEDRYQKEPGLWRARDLARIAREDALHQELDQGIDTITGQELPERGVRAGRQQVVTAATRVGVYVGDHTLEPDIAPLLHPEMAEAYCAFRQRESSRSAFRDALAPFEDGTATGQQRDTLVDKIEAIGKGRYAQRLAAHVASMRGLHGRVLELLDRTQGPITRDDLLTIEGPGAILGLLDDLSCAFRGQPLFPAASNPQPPAAPAAASPGPS
ncbi:AAA family ATPase [Streptomyces sp. SID13726]|uniref:AAA family ATPase n=1 Tax=Streptomyces sp. SID13726 TaxID=2706058 RepID=UPI0013B78D94|nr:AAA family ATPase [Streptomyces sp. SID13726]